MFDQATIAFKAKMAQEEVEITQEEVEINLETEKTNEVREKAQEVRKANITQEAKMEREIKENYEFLDVEENNEDEEDKDFGKDEEYVLL